MESSPEVVVAAEALRTWVQGQRASWSTPVPPPAPVSTPVPAAAAPAPPTPRSLVVEPIAHASAAGAIPVPMPAPMVHAPAAAAPQPTHERPLLVQDDEPEQSPSLMRRGLLIAAGLALVASIAGGAFMWGRGSAGPKVGTAAFDSAPAGAQVFVDGKPVGTTPVRVELNPGPHAVEFKLKDATRTQAITVDKGRELAVNIDWNPRRVGGLQVTSTPARARVLVDGKERGQTPLTLTDVLVGAHTVQIESSEGSVRRKVNIEEGRTESLVESIYPGWLHVSASIEVTVLDGSKAVLLDDSNRALLKPGVHSIRIENRALDFTQAKQVEIEPGGTTKIAIEVPTSTLSVTGSTGAEVFVDGTKAGETPLTEFPVKLGTRDIMVVDKTGVTRHASVSVTTKPAQLEISFSRP